MKFERFLCNIRPQSILRGSENHDTNGMEDTVPSHRKQLWFSSFSPLSLEISSCLTLRILCVLRRNRQVYMLGAHLYSCALTLRSAQNQVKMQKQKTTTNHRQKKLAETAAFRRQEWIKAASPWKEVRQLSFPFNQKTEVLPAQFVKFV